MTPPIKDISPSNNLKDNPNIKLTPIMIEVDCASGTKHLNTDSTKAISAKEHSAKELSVNSVKISSNNSIHHQHVKSDHVVVAEVVAEDREDWDEDTEAAVSTVGLEYSRIALLSILKFVVSEL